MRKFLFLSFLAGTLLVLGAPETWSQAVLTYGYGNNRLGANTHETVLTPTNVNVNTFGKKFSYPIDGLPYGQVLYVPNLSINGTVHNVVYVVTENNSIYAFDADGGGQLWHHFIDTPVPCAPINGCGVAPALGITATPVIDLSLGRIFVESRTAPQSGGYWHGLHALDLTTGQEVQGSPVVLSARVRGNGYDHDVNGYINFNSQTENDRSALLELNGVVYLSFASTGDTDPYHGWILGYDARTLQLLYTFCVTPNGSRGGIWGGPLAADNSGYIYAAVGNGTWDGTSDWGSSYLKLVPVGNTLQVSDYFTPFNYQTLNAEDLDLGSATATPLPWLGGTFPHEMIGAGKEGRIYVVNRDSMGKFHQGDDSQIVQEIPNALGQHTNHTYERSYSTPAYWGGWVYFIGTDDNVRSFKLHSGLLTTTPTAISPETFPFPGSNATISANGTTNGILWAVQRGSPPVLRAYKANNVGHELYNTAQNSSRDRLPGSTPKFTPPLVVNGKVYVGTSSNLTVYGLR
jgi:outer membrane protein assembly factor BamB